MDHGTVMARAHVEFGQVKSTGAGAVKAICPSLMVRLNLRLLPAERRRLRAWDARRLERRVELLEAVHPLVLRCGRGEDLGGDI